MIHGLKSYPAYKVSGVPWLGDVPEHWKVQRLKTAVDHINEQTTIKSDHDLYIALEHVESWTGRLLLPSGETQFDSQVKRFRAGDVLFGKLRPYLAKVVCPEQSGVCVGEFFVLRARAAAAPRYLEVVLRSASAIDYVNSSTFGAKMPRADWMFVGAMLFPIPPLPEQTAIVRFLDWADARIRKAIRARKRRIKLLEEFKQALIQQAVTGQIDVRTGKPYPSYKDSGVEWLGKVPEHWEVRRLGSVTQILNGSTPSSSRPEYWDGDIVWITPDDLGKLKGRYINNSSRRITQAGYNACGTTLATAGSIVLSTRAPIGHLGILRVAACANQGCRLLVPQAATASEFLYYVLVVSRPSLEILGQGSTFLELSRSKLGTFPIPFPPLPEQTAIVEYLDAKTAKIDTAIAATRCSIELLEEYRTRLIADVVTGKLDVREAAASLPEESPEELEDIAEELNLSEETNDEDLSDVESDETAEEDAYAD